MLEKKNALPRSELQATGNNRNSLAGAGQHHSDVRRAVVSAFGRVDEVVRILGNEAFKKLFQILAGSWIGIFHDNQTATCVFHENRRCPVAHTALIDGSLDLLGDFVSAFAVCANLDLFVFRAHFVRQFNAGRFSYTTSVKNELS